MFGINRFGGTGGSGSGKGEILKSGYKVGQALTTVPELKAGLNAALTFNKSEVNQNDLDKWAKINGQAKGFSKLAAKVSREKLAAAQGINQTYSVLMNHANGAANQELTWQRTTQRGLETLSEKMLDMSTTQNQYDGFAQYINRAESLLSGS